MKIILIGGCGYIGSKLFLSLKKNHEVATVDLEWFGNNVNAQNIKLDFNACLPWLSEYDAIILLAGHSSVPMCIQDRMSSFKNNVSNFLSLLTQIEKRGNKQKFIYASSSSVYGDTKEIAANESFNQFQPKTNYDLQKQEIDRYATLSDVEFYGLRFGTVNGWSPNLRTDIMLNKMFACAKQNGEISIFNKNIHRPILGINDLYESVEAILQGNDKRGIYNLASFNTSVEQISKTISKQLGDIKIIDKGSTPAYNFSIDTSKFETVYGFEFKDTIESIIDSLEHGWNYCLKSIREEKEYV